MNLVTLTPYYKVIADAQSRALDGTCYVTRGCTPTANGTGLRVDVSAGDSVEGGIPHLGYLGGNVTCATAPATPKYRRDIVYRDSAGALTVASGTAALLTSTTPVPPALPASATLLAVVFIAPGQTTLAATDVEDCRQVRRDQMDVFNVKLFGAVGDGTTDDTAAIAAAITTATAAAGNNRIIFFPPGRYAVTTIAIQDVHGLILQGVGQAGTGQPASFIVGPNAVNPIVVNVFSNSSSGSVSDIVIRDLGITYHSSSTNTTGLRIWNCLHFKLENLYIEANGIGLTLQGSGNFVVSNVVAGVGQSPANANGGLMIGNGGGTLTSSGPGVFHGGQFSGGGPNGTPAIRIGGGSFDIQFNGTQFIGSGAGYVAAVDIDGDFIMVDFNDCHGESNFNTSANTGVDFRIGNATKVDHVGIHGGSYFGHGDGSSYQNYSVQVVRCADIVVEGVTFWKNALNGYNGGCVRLESTAGAAGDVMRFSALQRKSVTADLYSDARSPAILGSSYLGSYTLGTETNDGLTINPGGLTIGAALTKQLVARYLNIAILNITNTTSGTYVDFGGLFTATVTTLAADQVCIRFTSNIKKATAGYASIVVDRGGSKLPTVGTNPLTWTDLIGSSVPFTYEFWDVPGAGTFTYKPQLYTSDANVASAGLGQYCQFIVEVWR